jgi:Tetratricopeptide repeat
MLVFVTEADVALVPEHNLILRRIDGTPREHLAGRSVAHTTVEDESYRVTIDAPSTPESYELYLRANELMGNRTRERVGLARDMYLDCIRKDPNYAPAWARLGRCYRVLEKFHGLSGGGTAARSAIERAFALNPDLGIAHNVCTPIQADAGEAESAMVRLLHRAASHDNNPELFCGAGPGLQILRAARCVARRASQGSGT